MTTINTDLARKFSKLLKDFQQRNGLSFSDLAFGLLVKEEDLRKWMGTDKEVPVEPPVREYDRLLSLLTSFNLMFSSRKKPEPKVWLDFVEIPGYAKEGSELVIEPFLMSTTPITNEVYGVFLEATNHRKPTYWHKAEYNRPKQPVVGVSWDDAMAFCDWAGVSLPSEAQWEYACRAGSTTKYHFGDDQKQLGEYAWYYDNSKGKLQDVAQKKPNAWGLYDMHGNVWEWTANHCDIQGRVLSKVSGGGWDFSAGFCRSSYRLWYDTSKQLDDLGFRVLKGGSWTDFYNGVNSQERAPIWSDHQSGIVGFRVLKGGSWCGDGDNCRSAARDSLDPSRRNNGLSFRVAQQIDQRISYVACQSVDPQNPQ
jgi:formylglycine-generating enzyme required for sulfatase activity